MFRRTSRWPAAAVAVIVAAALTSCRPAAEGFRLREGDLLFQDLDAGPLCDAIEKVTSGCRGAKFSHVGMAVVASGAPPAVLEAMPDGVKLTGLDEFLGRSRDADGRPKVVVGRLRREHRRLVPAALRAGRGLLGRPYDGVFAVGNDKYYCSELVYEAFRRANGGRPVFELAPMTFRDPATGETMPAWVEYFRELGEPVPEGEPGINPGGISRSPKIEIVHSFGRPAGW